ncbi:MAG: zf-HC2 domain-containing protein [Butyricicoccus sp.]|nr:zf-HC2 domain-containing protein [Butyricicoccus sp.]
MPNCEYFEELCSSSLDGELTRAQKRELEAHLAECPACAAYLEDLKLMRTAWEDLKEPLPEQLHEKIMGSILEEAQSKVTPIEKKKRRPPVFTMIAAAAACVMLVMSGAVNDLLGGVKVENSSTGAADTASGAAMEDVQEPEKQDTAIPETAAIVPSTIGPAQDNAQAGAQTEPDTQGSSSQSAPSTEESARSDQAASSASTDASSSAGNTPAVASAGVPQVNSRQVPANGAEKQAISLPEDLRTHQFSGCYVAVGSGDPSVLKDASLLEKIDNTYYFEVKSGVSNMESCLKALQDNGFETALRRDVGVTITENAESILLILVIQQ